MSFSPTGARSAALKSWSQTTDPAKRTSKARTKFLERFEREVDPDGTMPAAERARRAEQARRAYFLDLADKSAQARRKNKGAA